MQLKQIPGISTKTAEYIAEMYPGWSQLLAAFKEKSVDDIKKEFDSTKRIGIKKIQKNKRIFLQRHKERMIKDYKHVSP